MIRIHQLNLAADHAKGALKKKAARLLHLPEEEIAALNVVRRSVDARKKDRPMFSYIVDVELKNRQGEGAVVRRAKSPQIALHTEKAYALPKRGTEPLENRPVIVGAGPCGLFCALLLAENGFEPLLLEQGADADTRAKKVEQFWKEGPSALDEHSNVQFGEGGAGTFSDGKLNTLVKDVSGRNHEVLRRFAEAGAPLDILTDSLPHMGTDVLRQVVKNLRLQIQRAGGTVRFHAEVTDFSVRDGHVCGLTVNHQEEIAASTLILAVGHSARPLFALLAEKGVHLEAKPFAVGLRVLHPQKQINLAQYGAESSPLFGAAPYKLTAKTRENRGVYSFCMCPGGFVVNASSEQGGLAVNGMSNLDRAGESANSAIIVSVTPADFPGKDALSGVEFQRQLEKKAFWLGKGSIPVQLYGDYVQNRPSVQFGEVFPAFCGQTAFANLRGLLPESPERAFLEGMEQFGRRIPGFDRADAILAGIESRTSSPLRICRNEQMESSIGGLYPCGEGAGYAGGIMSAAMDGMKMAETLIARFRPSWD